MRMQTLRVEGPALYMDKPYYQYTDGVTSVDLGVRLQGLSTLPVVANLTVQQRSLKPDAALSSSAERLEYWLDQLQLVWEDGKEGMQTVRLHVAGNLTTLASGGLLVAIDAAENADVQRENSTSIFSALPSDQLIVSFDLQPDQARCYNFAQDLFP